MSEDTKAEQTADAKKSKSRFQRMKDSAALAASSARSGIGSVGTGVGKGIGSFGKGIGSVGKGLGSFGKGIGNRVGNAARGISESRAKKNEEAFLKKQEMLDEQIAALSNTKEGKALSAKLQAQKEKNLVENYRRQQLSKTGKLIDGVKRIDKRLDDMWDSTKYAILMIVVMWVVVLCVNFLYVKDHKSKLAIGLYSSASIMTLIIWFPIRKIYLNYYFGASSTSYSKANYMKDKKNKKRQMNAMARNGQPGVMPIIATSTKTPAEIKAMTYNQARADPAVKTVCFIRDTTTGTLFTSNCDDIDKENEEIARLESDKMKRAIEAKKNEELAKAVVESNNKIIDSFRSAKVTVGVVPESLPSDTGNVVPFSYAPMNMHALNMSVPQSSGPVYAIEGEQHANMYGSNPVYNEAMTQPPGYDFPMPNPEEDAEKTEDLNDIMEEMNGLNEEPEF